VVLHVLARGEGRVRGPGDGAVGAHELPRQGRGGDGVQAEVEAARGNGRGSGDRGDVARAGGFTGPDRGDVLSELSLGRGVEGARVDGEVAQVAVVDGDLERAAAGADPELRLHDVGDGDSLARGEGHGQRTGDVLPGVKHDRDRHRPR